MIANDLVTEITRTVAAEQSHLDLDLVGVLSSGGSERVELLIAMANEDDEPRRFMITVPRMDVSEFESELRSKLSRVVRTVG